MVRQIANSCRDVRFRWRRSELDIQQGHTKDIKNGKKDGTIIPGCLVDADVECMCNRKRCRTFTDKIIFKKMLRLPW